MKVVTYLGSLVQLCCGEWGTLQTNIPGVCGERSHCLSHTGFAPALCVCAFPICTGQALGCSVGQLSKVGPGLPALPGSKPLRFRFLGTPPRRRLGWACVLCPSQVRAARVAWCLAALSPQVGRGVLSPPGSRMLSSPGAQQEHHLRCAVCSSGELISGCDPPCGCQPSRIPGRLG